MLDYVLEIRYPSDRRDLEDQVESVLFLSLCSGSSIEAAGDETVVSCYYPDPASRNEGRRILGDREGITVRLRDEPHVDWLERYEHSLSPMLVGERFVVAPNPALINEPDRIALIIPQERAFGTGSHESTALCLEMLETLDLGNSRALDIGTGSGILAIGMARLGAPRVVAFDNDIDTFGVATRNLQRNGLRSSDVRLFFGTPAAIHRAARFDVVTMNILPGVIIASLGQVVPLLAPGARLILSGIVTEAADEVRTAALSHGLKVEHELSRGEWWSVRLTTA